MEKSHTIKDEVKRVFREIESNITQNNFPKNDLKKMIPEWNDKDMFKLLIIKCQRYICKKYYKVNNLKDGWLPFIRSLLDIYFKYIPSDQVFENIDGLILGGYYYYEYLLKLVNSAQKLGIEKQTEKFIDLLFEKLSGIILGKINDEDIKTHELFIRKNLNGIDIKNKYRYKVYELIKILEDNIEEDKKYSLHAINTANVRRAKFCLIGIMDGKNPEELEKQFLSVSGKEED